MFQTILGAVINSECCFGPCKSLSLQWRIQGGGGGGGGGGEGGITDDIHYQFSPYLVLRG